ncbi:MAG: 6-bladed beta-propeller, partial [Actinomycetia bacterium]|nr:6-bladed beta-propeller [Actinomycetes bacterium]
MKKLFKIFLITGLLLSGTGIIFSEIGDFDINLYRSEKLYKEGYMYYNYMKYSHAIDYLTRSLTSYSRNFAARELLGRAYYMSGYLDNALLEWKTLIELGGGNNLLRQRINGYLYRAGKSVSYDIDKLEKEYLRTLIFDGKIVRDGMFTSPTDIIVDKNGIIYIAAFASDAIVKLSAEGKFLGRITGGLKRFNRPYSLTFLEKKNIIVTEFGADRIQIIDTDGKGITVFGEKGIDKGQFHGPEGVAVDGYNNIFVVDSGNFRVQKFNSSGKFLAEFGEQGSESEPGKFVSISGIDIDSDNNIWVTDNRKGKLIIFDAAGNFMREIGGPFLKSPRDISIISRENILIQDSQLGLINYNDSDALSRYVYAERGIFSAALDYNRVLYYANFSDSILNVCIPKKLKYINLDLFIEKVDVNNYPTVACFFTVRTRDGEFVRNLTEKNFFMYDGDLKIFPVYATYPDSKDNFCKTTFLIEKTPEMKNYINEISEFADLYLKKTDNVRDVTQIIEYSKDVSITEPYTTSRLKIIQSIKKDSYSQGNMAGKAIYFGATEVSGRKGKRALILFTTGNLNSKSFFKFDEETVINFCRNNHVPVYIISLEKNRKY